MRQMDSLPKDATLVEDDVIRYQEVIEDLSQDLNEHRKYLNNRYDSYNYVMSHYVIICMTHIIT